MSIREIAARDFTPVEDQGVGRVPMRRPHDPRREVRTALAGGGSQWRIPQVEDRNARALARDEAADVIHPECIGSSSTPRRPACVRRRFPCAWARAA
ncbi:MAG: hypothetical protein IT519_02910 [Burkholderiales bacterium]|nr:hypothetical protein [Burkholderiales bacterium]